MLSTVPISSNKNHVIPRVLRLELPSQNAIPLLLDSPHSGTYYPEDFGYSLELAKLQQNEDNHVNELYGLAPQYGAALLEALFSRNYIDLNRAADDVDPEVVDAPYPGARPSPNSKLGRGLLWRLMSNGDAVYNRRLSVAEVKARIESYHRPYHQLLAQQLRRLHREFGQVWHINCHSMSSVSGAQSPDGKVGVERPDFVLGDHFGTSCEPAMTQFVHETLEKMGYTVDDNVPYKGAELTLAYSKPALGFHSLQIEINSKLYMNEETREKNAGFDKLRGNLTSLVTQLSRFVTSRVVKDVHAV